MNNPEVSQKEMNIAHLRNAILLHHLNIGQARAWARKQFAGYPERLQEELDAYDRQLAELRAELAALEQDAHE